MTKPEAITNSKTSGVNKTRQHILDVSAALFSEKGYNGTPLRDIAAAANMKAGSLYYHFDSKEQLILEIMTTGVEHIHQCAIRNVNALPENSSTRAILDAAAKGHLEALLDKGDYSSTSIRNYGQIPESIRSVILKTRDKYEELWRQWLIEGQEKGEIRSGVNLKILRLSILSVLNRTMEWHRPKAGRLNAGEIAEIQIGFFWDGIGDN